jgi:hypothetical protein
MARPGRAYKTRHPKKRAFLQSYEQHGYVGRAASEAGVHRTTVYDWLKSDPEFAADVETAEKAVLERMEEEADRRAIQGMRKPVFYRGDVCGHVQEYSDNLLMFRMKALAPEKYRDRQSIEHSGPDGGPIRHKAEEGLDLSKLSDEELAELEKLVEKAEHQSRADPDRAG